MTLETAKLVDVQASQDDKWIRTYEATWEIWVPDDEDPEDYGVIATAHAPGLPTIGTSYSLDGETDSWAFWTPYIKVSRKSGGSSGERVCYTAKMKASNKPMDREQADQYDDPLLEPPKIDTTYARFQKFPRKDLDGKLYENALHEPFTHAVDDARAVVNITNVNRLSHNLDQISDFINCVNDATLWGLSAGKVRFSEHSMERLLYGTSSFYFKHSYGFEINKEGWQHKEIHRGHFYLKDGKETLNQVKGNHPKQCYLKADGTKLDPLVDDPEEIEFRDHEEENLLLLGIPATF